jgi:hypothetical protein
MLTVHVMGESVDGNKSLTCLLSLSCLFSKKSKIINYFNVIDPKQITIPKKLSRMLVIFCFTLFVSTTPYFLLI